MRKTLKRVAVILAIAFVAAQLVRPAKTNPSFASAQTIENIVDLPPELHATLMRACGDCHSDETKWPWYSDVAPASWFVIHHVVQGRRRINLSTWVRPGKEPVDSIDRLKAICREVRKGGMPLTSYTLIHWSARLSADDVEQICKWSEEEQQRLGGPIAEK
jgi:heme-binding protein